MKDKYDLEGKNHKLIREFTNPSITKLVDLYKKDPKLAKIYYLSADRNNFGGIKEILFYTSPDEFEIVTFNKLYGISKTSRMYSNEHRSSKLKFTKNGAYEITYYKSKPSIRTAKIQNIPTDYVKILNHYRPWTKFLFDNIEICGGMTLNKIYSQKLFTEKKLVKYTLKIPLRVYHQLKKTEGDGNPSVDEELSYFDVVPSNHRWIRNSGFRELKYNFNQKWVEIKNKHLIYELLFIKQLPHNILIDTIELARNFDNPINLNWSVKRFSSEHDKMSKEVTNTILEFDNRDLNIGKQFLDFSGFSGIDILKTTKELGLEGKKQKHCVASYTNNVDFGKSGIYHINGYTLELKLVNNNLVINQFRGNRNCAPPKELLNQVQNIVDEYNKSKIGTLTQGVDQLNELNEMIF